MNYKEAAKKLRSYTEEFRIEILSRTPEGRWVLGLEKEAVELSLFGERGVKDGIMSEIKKHTVHEFNASKNLTFEDLMEMFSEIEEKRKNSPITAPMAQLLSMNDDQFKACWKNDSIMWIGGINLYDKVEKRAKKLNLI